ncbi:unnamed protein product [Schistosoma turkestanicum]|nr:unnamed protein product [Schistosoma turkestanicum]
MIHTYSSQDSHKCFKRLAPWGDVVRLYFVGDSRLKKLFNAFVYHINGEVIGENITLEASVPSNFQYVTTEVDLRFFHHDEITDDTLELVKSWIGPTNVSNVTESNIQNKKTDGISTPTHLIISMGTKTIQHYNRSEDGLLEYMNGVKRLTVVLEELKFARSVWMLQETQLYIPVENDADDDNVKINDKNNNNNNDNNHNHNNNTETTNSLFVEFYELTSALSKFGAIMMYFFICDRTILFMKANKFYTNLSFILPIIYCFVLGLFFSGPTKRTQVNHLDITREWKGWMQLYLLIYHFTDSYNVTPIFMLSRLVVSSYLFLSGYGHFCYFWRKPVPQINWLKLLNYRRFSREFCTAWKALWQILHRYLIVIYRYNFFVFGLCLVMNRGYLAYYFVPLISFWFTVTLIVCVIFPRVSDQKVYGNQNKRDNIDQNDNNTNLNNISSNSNNSNNSTHPDSIINVTITTTANTIPSTTTTTSTNIISNLSTAVATSTSKLDQSYNYNRKRYFNQQYCTTSHNDYSSPSHQYIESDDEVYFHQSPARFNLNMKKPLLMPTSSPSSLSTSTDTVIDELLPDHIPYPPPPSSSSSSCSLSCKLMPSTNDNYSLHKGHYKALSVGTGFDLCQNYSLTTNSTTTTTDTDHTTAYYNSQFCHYQKPVEHRLHRTVVKSRGRLGPPLTEDLIRKFQCIVLPIKNKISSTKSSSTWNTTTTTTTTTTTPTSPSTITMNKKRLIIMKQPSSSESTMTSGTTTSTKCCKCFQSICFIHCSRIRLIYVIMIIKFIGLICLVESLYRSKGFFHWLFFSRSSSSTQADIVNHDEKLWFYRWSIDRYSVIYGMIFAFLCESLRQNGILHDTDDNYDDNNNNNSIGNDDIMDYIVHNDGGIHQSDKIHYSQLLLHNKNYNLMTTMNTNNDNHNHNNNNSSSNINNNKMIHNHLNTDYHKQFQNTHNYHDESTVMMMTNRSYEYFNHSTNYTMEPYNNDSIVNSNEHRYTNHLQKSIHHVNSLSSTSSSSSSLLFSHLIKHNTEYSYCFSIPLLYKCFSSLGLTILGVIGLTFSCIYIFACSNRETCLRIHAYMCLIPIISYILVRNSFSSLRRIYSIFFAWIGDMSLELFIAQYHIWLSADAYGILVLLPGFPLINLTVTSFIFICICHEVHSLTHRLQNYIIPNSPLKFIRNALIFALIFHLITNSTSQMMQLDFS